MSLTRRNAIVVLGGGGIIAAATAAAGTFALTRTPSRALAPWEAAGGETEPRRRALSYAILAPNPHNRQPWLVDLDTADTVVVHRDRTRELPSTDPHARQLTIGLGCFLELMTVAASATGHAVDLELFPEGEDGPVAVARLRQGAAPDPLFAHVLDRRSCKEPFDDRPIPEPVVAKLAAHAGIVTDPAEVAALRRLTWDAWKTEAYTPRALKESVDLMRFGKGEIEVRPDGIDLGGPFLEVLMLAGVLTREAQIDTTSIGFREGLRIYEEMLAATPAYAVLTTPGNDRADQIASGRRWLRLNLTTASLGLALHPVSQALQEFPEMADHYAEAHRRLARPGETVQMLGRLGYGPVVPPSPRWPLETRIVHG